MIHVRVDFRQLLKLQEKIPELGRMTFDMRHEWEAVVEALKKEVGSVFQEEGPGWAPLALSTQLDRKRSGYGVQHPILVREGAMRRTFVQDPLVVSEPQFLFYGSTSEIARYHQKGTKRSGSHWKLPKRPILQAERLTPVIQRAFEEAFTERANRVWREVTSRGVGLSRTQRAA